MKINPINLCTFGYRPDKHRTPVADVVSEMRANGYGNYETDDFGCDCFERRECDDFTGYTDDEVLNEQDLADIALSKGHTLDELY